MAFMPVIIPAHEHGTIAKRYASRVICQFVSFAVGCQTFSLCLSLEKKP